MPTLYVRGLKYMSGDVLEFIALVATSSFVSHCALASLSRARRKSAPAESAAPALAALVMAA